MLEYEDIVVVIKGKHKGKIGMYDDDAEQDCIIVYPGVPLITGYIVVRESSVRKATPQEAQAWREREDNELARKRAVNMLKKTFAARNPSFLEKG